MRWEAKESGQCENVASRGCQALKDVCGRRVGASMRSCGIFRMGLKSIDFPPIGSCSLLVSLPLGLLTPVEGWPYGVPNEVCTYYLADCRGLQTLGPLLRMGREGTGDGVSHSPPSTVVCAWVLCSRTFGAGTGWECLFRESVEADRTAKGFYREGPLEWGVSVATIMAQRV